MANQFRQSIFSFDMDMDADVHESPKKIKAGKENILNGILVHRLQFRRITFIYLFLIIDSSLHEFIHFSVIWSAVVIAYETIYCAL